MGWRKLQNEESISLHRLPNIGRMVRFVGLSWTAHVARVEGGRAVDR